MITIYKYPLIGRYNTKISLPEGAEIVHAAKQNDQYCFWAKVNTDAPVEERSFTVVGTGWDIDENMVHVGTLMEGSFVWHIMEIING